MAMRLFPPTYSHNGHSVVSSLQFTFHTDELILHIKYNNKCVSFML